MLFVRFIASLLFTASAIAGETPRLTHAGTSVDLAATSTGSSRLPCQCRALGRMWEHGEEVCLDLGAGRQAFLCDMHQNVTTWRALGKTCPES